MMRLLKGFPLEPVFKKSIRLRRLGKRQHLGLCLAQERLVAGISCTVRKKEVDHQRFWKDQGRTVVRRLLGKILVGLGLRYLFQQVGLLPGMLVALEDTLLATWIGMAF